MVRNQFLGSADARQRLSKDDELTRDDGEIISDGQGPDYCLLVLLCSPRCHPRRWVTWTVVKWLQIGKCVTPWGEGKGRTEAAAKLGTKIIFKKTREAKENNRKRDGQRETACF
jgi:hypothetical protein